MTSFDEAFRASVGPVWNTQHVGQPQGEHWLNTWFAGHFFQTARLYDVPPWDLLVVYGPKETEKAVSIGAVETLFVSQQKLDAFEKLMETQERMRGAVVIIGSDHELGEQFLHLGGIAGFLRFKTDF